MKLTQRKKLLIYKVLLFAFAFVIAFLPATASRNLEVNSRVIVEMLGIDETGSGVEVTAQYIMPTDTEGASSKDKVSSEGRTVTEAVEGLSTALGRRAELGHCSMLILGSSVKPSTLKSLMTGTDVSADVYVSAASDKARELVGDLVDFMKKTSATDADFIAYGAKRSHIATTTLLNLLSDVGSVSHTAFVPVVEMTEEKESNSGGSGDSGGSSGGSSSGSSGGSGQGGGKSGMKTEKLALYGEDGRLGVLEKQSARGVAWVSAVVEKSVVTADIDYGGERFEGVTGRLVDKSARIKLAPEEKKAVIEVRAAVKPMCDRFNRLNEEKGARDAIRRGFEEAIEGEVKSGYREALKISADPMFLVRQFYRYAPDVYEQGLPLYDIVVDVNVTVDIK